MTFFSGRDRSAGGMIAAGVMPGIDVQPVTEENWRDFAQLFEAKGGPHYCWCTPHRFHDAPDRSNDEKKGLMRQLVRGGTPIGVLAYAGAEPIGWCSVAPRVSYPRLARSRTMPRVTPDETPTWTILCFFVARRHRGRGVTHALLDGAVAYAGAHGAVVVEGYPFDTTGTTATHRGHSRAFRRARFQQDGRRWFRRVGTR